MTREGEPFSDMSIFDNDKNPIESGEKFTVGEWKELTKSWHPVNVFIAKAASEKPFEKRQEIVLDVDTLLFFDVFGDKEYVEFIQSIWELSDKALSKLTQALTLNEMEGRYQKPEA